MARAAGKRTGAHALRSGLWVGHYVQHRCKHRQELRLEFADGLLRGDGIDGIGPFTVEGEYRVSGGQVRLGWIKTYEGAHSVLYLGRLLGERIVGDWSIHGFGERFALAPAGGRDLGSGP